MTFRIYCDGYQKVVVVGIELGFQMLIVSFLRGGEFGDVVIM